jgi:nicotinamide-nucleotide amidase
MKAEIISIGDEILIGQITNTNSVWMAQQLNLIGVTVAHICTVADQEEVIKSAMSLAGTRASLVLITGGLGPTKDDVTRKAFAEFFNTTLELNHVVLKDISDYYAKKDVLLSETNKRQAILPLGAEIIKNPVGTAPAMMMRKEQTLYISMPGVPYEMKSIMQEHVLPAIKKNNTLPAIFHKTVLTYGIAESTLSEIIAEWEDSLAQKNIKLAYLPQPGMVRLRLSAYGAMAAEIQSQLEQEIVQLNKLIKEYILGYETFGEEEQTPQKIVSNLLREKKQTLSIAESCTGGYLSSLFTAIPGASEIFKGSVVPYSNQMKHKILGVDESLFETVGVVSKECVEQLAANVLKRFETDYSISVSGIAGPGGATDEKPVGLVWICVANKNKVVSKKYLFGDDRQRNIIRTSFAAIDLLRQLILENQN